MSRIAKKPIFISNEINIKIDGQKISIKGKLGELNYKIHESVKVNYNDSKLTINKKNALYNKAIAGTTRAILNSIVIGVTNGFIKKLQLIGIGYRATVKGNMISLSLGYSHIINYKLPIGITAECPSQTEIVLKGMDKQVIGQVAADIRAYRRPEYYKGKGVRYYNEIIRTKEAKKK